MIPDNAVLIAEGRQLAVTIHRAKHVTPESDITIDIQAVEPDGRRDHSQAATVRLSVLQEIYDSLRNEEPCKYVRDCLHGKLTLQLNKYRTLKMTQHELYRVIVSCRRRVRELSS